MSFWRNWRNDSLPSVARKGSNGKREFSDLGILQYPIEFTWLLKELYPFLSTYTSGGHLYTRLLIRLPSVQTLRYQKRLSGRTDGAVSRMCSPYLAELEEGQPGSSEIENILAYRIFTFVVPIWKMSFKAKWCMNERDHFSPVLSLHTHPIHEWKLHPIWLFENSTVKYHRTYKYIL